MFTKVLALFVAVAAFTPALAQVAPTCYGDGLADAAACSPFVSDFCNTMGAATYRNGDGVTRCYMANGHRCHFTLFNTGINNARVSTANCRAVLTNAINTCPMGGKGKFQPNLPYTFTVDPNDGSCSSDVY